MCYTSSRHFDLSQKAKILLKKTFFFLNFICVSFITYPPARDLARGGGGGGGLLLL